MDHHVMVTSCYSIKPTGIRNHDIIFVRSNQPSVIAEITIRFTTMPSLENSNHSNNSNDSCTAAYSMYVWSAVSLEHDVSIANPAHDIS